MAINNNRKRKLLSWVVMMAITLLSSTAVYAGDENSNRRERNYIRSGNELYDQGRYAEAEVEYKKALVVPRTKIILPSKQRRCCRTLLQPQVTSNLHRELITTLAMWHLNKTSMIKV